MMLQLSRMKQKDSRRKAFFSAAFATSPSDVPVRRGTPVETYRLAGTG
jgi:hypothetical protein